jgi:hypothetical protein
MNSGILRVWFCANIQEDCSPEASMPTPEEIAFTRIRAAAERGTPHSISPGSPSIRSRRVSAFQLQFFLAQPAKDSNSSAE